MSAVIKNDGQPCQCGFCRPDLNLVAVDMEIPVQVQATSQEAEFQRQTRVSAVRSTAPQLVLN